MNYNDLENIYESWKTRYGNETYRYISAILAEAKQSHKTEWLHDHPDGDHEQSWRAFKGKNLEKLIYHMLEVEVAGLGLGIFNGNALERTNPANLSLAQDKVRRGLLVHFGEFDFLPDIDLVIYDPRTSECKVIAVISSKVTLRERIAQTGYWKLKLLEAPVTRGIRVYFVTPDEDATLRSRTNMKKGRAIVEFDTDGAYVLSGQEVEQNDKVKSFDHFVDDLKKLIS